MKKNIISLSLFVSLLSLINIEAQNSSGKPNTPTSSTTTPSSIPRPRFLNSKGPVCPPACRSCSNKSALWSQVAPAVHGITVNQNLVTKGFKLESKKLNLLQNTLQQMVNELGNAAGKQQEQNVNKLLAATNDTIRTLQGQLNQLGGLIGSAIPGEGILIDINTSNLNNEMQKINADRNSLSYQILQDLAQQISGNSSAAQALQTLIQCYQYDTMSFDL